MDGLLIYPLVGSAAGFVAGLLGVGGGIIIVPSLAFVFHAKGFPPEAVMHLAVATSLSSIVVTSLSSVRAHHAHGAVRWPLFAQLGPGFALGALLGTLIADALDSDTLRMVFGGFVVVVGAHLLLGGNPASHRDPPRLPGMLSVGTVIGAVSAVVGIGGGNLTVPFLVWCNVPIRNAVATAAAAGIPIAVVGTGGFVLAGLDAPNLPAWSTGYVYWPAFLGIGAMSMLFAPLGARLTHTLPTPLLRRGFGLFLAAVGVNMLWG